ncbi:MAG: methyl-accepting chemotaxis protein [Methylovirgula sp.]
MAQAGNLDERLQFIKIDPHAKEIIRSLRPFLQQHLPKALDVLYEQIHAFPETRRYFPSDIHVKRAHEAQLRHWDLISDGHFDTRYLEAARKNGEVHARIGLEPRWYIAGYALVLEPLIHEMVQQTRSSGWPSEQKDRKKNHALAEALSAVVKCVMLDIDMVISTYFEAGEVARRQAEEDATKAERAIVSSSIGAALSRLADKDLTFRLTATMPAAYHQLQDDFNTALQQLEAAIVRVGSCAEAIRASAGEISVAADDLSKRTEQQAAGLEETAAALEEIMSTVANTAQGTIHAADIVAITKGEAEKTHGVVQQAVAAMTRIKKSSEQITQIIGVIDEIAFQTNLLALNAGVEAARAGHAGKGFAVVASEVRALAQRSAQAAKEIAGLIMSSTREVEQGVALVGQTGTALQGIVTRFSDIDRVVSEIAGAAKEQAAGLSEVNVAVGQMDKATQHNAAMVEETTAATRNLRLEMEELLNLIANFNVTGEATVTEERYSAEPTKRAARR